MKTIETSGGFTVVCEENEIIKPRTIALPKPADHYKQKWDSLRTAITEEINAPEFNPYYTAALEWVLELMNEEEVK